MTDMQTMVREYITNRDNMVERYKGKGRVLMGAASKPTQMQFIQMTNEESVRFANLFDRIVTRREWDAIIEGVNTILGLYQGGFRDVRIWERNSIPRDLRNTFGDTTDTIMSLTEWEAISELSRTYRSLLGQDDAK